MTTPTVSTSLTRTTIGQWPVFVDETHLEVVRDARSQIVVRIDSPTGLFVLTETGSLAGGSTCVGARLVKDKLHVVDASGRCVFVANPAYMVAVLSAERAGKVSPDIEDVVRGSVEDRIVH